MRENSQKMPTPRCEFEHIEVYSRRSWDFRVAVRPKSNQKDRDEIREISQVWFFIIFVYNYFRSDLYAISRVPSRSSFLTVSMLGIDYNLTLLCSNEGKDYLILCSISIITIYIEEMVQSGQQFFPLPMWPTWMHENIGRQRLDRVGCGFWLCMVPVNDHYP